MTIAFVLQTHRAPGEVARLVAALHAGAPNSLIVISHDGSPDDCARLEALPGVVRALPAAGGRGQFSMLDGLFAAFRNLEKLGRPYDWVVTLSGQDYPIRPMRALESELARSPMDGYFHHFDTERQPPFDPRFGDWPAHEVETRYHFHATRLRRNLSTFDRALLRLCRDVLNLSTGHRLHTAFGLNYCRRADWSPFGPEFRLHGGSYWLTIRRKCVRALLDFLDDRPDVTDYFRKVLVPEEAFIPTVLANDASIRLSGRDHHYFDFRSSRHGRPAIMNRDHLANALGAGCYFARKFDYATQGELLDYIDEHLLGHDSHSDARDEVRPAGTRRPRRTPLSSSLPGLG